MKPTYTDYLYLDNVSVIIPDGTGTFNRNTGTYVRNTTFSIESISIEHTENGTTTAIPVSIIDSRIYGSFLVTTNTELEITIRFNITGVGRFVKFTITGLNIGTYTISGIYEYISTRKASIKNIILTKTNTLHTWEECHGLIAAFIDTADALPVPDVYVYNHYFPSNIDGKNTDHYILRYVKNPGTHSGDFARTPDCIVTGPSGIGLIPPQWDGYIAIPLKMIHLNYKDDYGVEYTDLTNNYYVIGEPIADIQRQIKYKNNIGKVFPSSTNHIYANSSCPILHLELPSETSTYIIVYDSAIQKINNEAFYSTNSINRTTEITEIIIPDTTAVIESSAFKDCSSLVSINTVNKSNVISLNTLPNNITLILPHTFLNCKSLKQLIIPNKVEEIQDYAFSGCSNLGTVSLSTTSPYLKGIGKYAFSGNTVLRTINLPYSLQSIGEYAFNNSGLNLLILPKNVNTIGTAAFLNSSNMHTVVFDVDTLQNELANIRTISSLCFASCSKLQYINTKTELNTISEGVTTILTGAFKNTSIREITFPTTIAKAEHQLFAGNTHLGTVSWKPINCTGFTAPTTSPFYTNRDTIHNFTFGNLVLRIPSYICYGMYNLDDIIIPNSVKEIGVGSFKNCTYISTVSFVLNNNKVNITTIPLDCFSGDIRLVSINRSDGRNNIPEGVKNVKINAFKDTSLTNITIPETLETSDPSIFAGNSVLTSVKWNAINCNNFNSSIAGPFYANKTQIENFTFGNKVKHIPSFLCFYMDNANHTQAIVPSSCEIIDKYAFYFNHKLTYLQLGTSNTGTLTQDDMNVSLKTINDGAFGLCAGVSTCLIPYNVTLIGPLSFLSLGLSTSDGTTLYYRAYNTTTISVYLPDGEIAKFPFYNSKIHKAFFEDGAAFIPSNLLHDAFLVNQIHVSRSVIEIGKNIFNNNYLKTMIFLSGTRILDNRAFSVDSYITTNNLKICFPSSLAYIGISAFENRQNLYEIQLGFGIREIDKKVFKNCYSELDCYCLSIEPAALDYELFDTLHAFDGYKASGDRVLTLHIPESNLNWYKKEAIWKYYKNNIQTIPVYPILNKETNTLYYYGLNRHIYKTTNVVSREALVTFNPSLYNNPVNIVGQQITSINPSYTTEDLINVPRRGNLIIPRTVTIENQTYTVTEIGEEAFRGCTDIKYLYLPTSIKYIGPKAFWGCSNLEEIYFYNNEYEIFNDIIPLDSDDSELTTIDRLAFKDCVKLKTMGSTNTFKLPNTVTSIEELSFSCCYSISDIEIGDRLFNIPINAFERCRSIVNMTISTRNHYYSTDNTQGAVSLYNKDKSKLFKVFDHTDINESLYNYIVRDDVKTICSLAFTYCRHMKSLTIGKSVKDIVINGLFYECNNLQEIIYNSSENISTLQNFLSIFNDKVSWLECKVVQDPPKTFVSRYDLRANQGYSGYEIINIRKELDPMKYFNYNKFNIIPNITSFKFYFNEWDGLNSLNNVKFIPPYTCYKLDLSEMAIEDGLDINYYTIINANNNIKEIGTAAFEECLFNYGTIKRNYLRCQNVITIHNAAFKKASILGVILGTNLKRIELDAFNGLTNETNSLYIIYNGILEQWNNVTKEIGWNFGTTVYLKTNDTEWNEI